MNWLRVYFTSATIVGCVNICTGVRSLLPLVWLLLGSCPLDYRGHCLAAPLPLRGRIELNSSVEEAGWSNRAPLIGLASSP